MKGVSNPFGEFREELGIVCAVVGGRGYVYIGFHIAEGARPMNGFCARVFTVFVEKVA